MKTYHVLMKDSSQPTVVLRAESFNIYEQQNEVCFWGDDDEQCGFFKLDEVLGVVRAEIEVENE